MKLGRLVVLVAALAALTILAGCSDGQVHGNNDFVGGSATVGTF